MFCRFSFLLFLLPFLVSCVTSRRSERCFSKKIRKEVEHSDVFNRAFTGFALLDPETGKTLVDVNGSKYFTPASNTKILTLATCLEVLGDSVPGIKISKSGEGNDAYYLFKPTGDPTFLHPMFKEWQPVFHFFEKCGPAEFDLDVFQDTRFGPGWAWDDYNEGYSPERSAMPIFGNVRTIRKKDGVWHHLPFDDGDRWGWNLVRRNDIKDLPDSGEPLREEKSNIIYIPPGETLPDGYMKNIPFLTSHEFALYDLLRDTLGSGHVTTNLSFFREKKGGDSLSWRTLYSTPLDTALRRMMYQSDNFIAEQLLLLCAGQKFDILQQDTMIKWMLDSALTNLPQRPRWVDGSGLSRYNLISPRDLSLVLLKLWKEQPRAYLMSLFPAGGMNGTVSGWYSGGNGKPYVFAKTGSMSGVHCLSGYVVTERGKTLIFSFMHNNFVGSNKAWKQEMQRVLELIHDTY